MPLGIQIAASILGLGLILLSLGLLIAAFVHGFQTGISFSKCIEICPKDSISGTCDPGWQSKRDGLFISAFSFSLITLLFLFILVVVILAVLSRKAHHDKPKELDAKENQVRTHYHF